MSVVARDETNGSHIIFPWPNAVPWGAELVCGDEEVAIICPNWQVGEQLGPGRHTISPPNPQAHITAYFFSTTPKQVEFKRSINVLDRASNQATHVHYQGRAKIKIGDPMLMCHQLVGLPYHDLATGVLRSARTSLEKVFQHVLTKVCLASPSIATISSADAVAQLVEMASNANPMAVAVTGLKLVSFEEFQLTIGKGEPIDWQPDVEGVKTTPINIADSGPSTDRLPLVPPIDGDTSSDHAPDQAGEVTGEHDLGEEQPSPSMRPDTGDRADDRTGDRAGDRTGDRTSDRTLRDEKQPIPSGTAVLVYGNDGLWHAATVQQYDGSRYQIAMDGTTTVVWVPATQVRPR